ncbi:Txe/YoeB family addiction module toxin [Nocardia spumae]|uniref:Txe/YoeB family addiction module toxin n=1 Tax=Nocardia spumae TaxID=2887190 RepID=UPI003557B3A2
MTDSTANNSPAQQDLAGAAGQRRPRHGHRRNQEWRERGPRLRVRLDGWETYTSWPARDRTVLKAANKLITAVLADPFTGIGKPEPLKYQLAGNWSRRITREHRLIYYVTDSEVAIVCVGGHYDDRGTGRSTTREKSPHDTGSRPHSRPGQGSRSTTPVPLAISSGTET